MPIPGQAITNSQKAALLIQSLGRERADEILASLPPEQALRIRQALHALATVPNETKRAVMRELRALAAPPPDPDAPFLTTLTPERAAELLAGEPPRLVALLLAALPVDRTRTIIARLPEEERARVKTQYAEVTPPAPLVRQHLEQALRTKADHFHFSETLQGITTQEQLAPTPAAQPVSPPPPAPHEFTFATLAALEKGVLREVISRAHVDDVVMALRGAEPSFITRLLQVMPSRMRAAIRAQLKVQQPVRLRDILCAQTNLCRLAQAVIAGSAGPTLEEPVYA